ncbi:hypothetical protein ACFQMM_19305 [Saliphagus sp. GCM10025308]
MLELAYVFVVGVIGVFFIGYCTPKFALWGSIGTAMMWMTAFLVPSFSPGEVIDTVGPHILNLFMVYPKAVGLAWDSQTADAGLLGGLAVLVWAVILLVPYIYGLILGVTTWPELFVFRVLL